jgi:hypothetical protein
MNVWDCIEGLELIVNQMKPRINLNLSSLLTEKDLSKVIDNKNIEDIQNNIDYLNDDLKRYKVGVKLDDGLEFSGYNLYLFSRRMNFWLKDRSLGPFIYRMFTSNFQLEYKNQLVDETSDFLKELNYVKEELYKQIDLLKTAVNDILKEKSPYWPKESIKVKMGSSSYWDTSDQYTDFGTFA